jgi:hypothetical protein
MDEAKVTGILAEGVKEAGLEAVVGAAGSSEEDAAARRLFSRTCRSQDMDRVFGTRSGIGRTSCGSSAPSTPVPSAPMT